MVILPTSVSALAASPAAYNAARTRRVGLKVLFMTGYAENAARVKRAIGYGMATAARLHASIPRRYNGFALKAENVP